MQWSEKWQMSFNFNKCKAMHIGSRNSKYAYNMRGDPLQTVNKESDLRVTISSDLTPPPKKNVRLLARKPIPYSDL